MRSYDFSQDGPIFTNGAALGGILGGAARNPIDQIREGVSEGRQWWDSEEGRKHDRWKNESWQEWWDRTNNADRSWKTGEREGSQDWATRERQGSQDWATGERREGQDWRSGENKAGRDWASGESSAWRDWAGSESERNRGWSSREAEADRGLIRREGESNRAWGSGESSKKIAADAAAQERDIQARREQALMNQNLKGYQTPAALYGQSSATQQQLRPSFGAQRQYDQVGEADPLNDGLNAGFQPRRAQQQRGEATLLDPQDKQSSPAFTGQRSLMDRGEANVLGVDGSVGKLNNNQPAIKNSSFLHGDADPPPPYPGRTGLDNSNKTLVSKNSSSDGVDMTQAQNIVRSWDNRPPSTRMPGTQNLGNSTTRGAIRGSTFARQFGNSSIGGVNIPSTVTRSRVGKIHNTSSGGMVNNRIGPIG